MNFRLRSDWQSLDRDSYNSSSRQSRGRGGRQPGKMREADQVTGPSLAAGAG